MMIPGSFTSHCLPEDLIGDKEGGLLGEVKMAQQNKVCATATDHAIPA